MLTEIEKKFCKCVNAVRQKKTKSEAYAICTNSIYRRQGLVRQRMVACKMEKSRVDQLRNLARDRGLSIYKGRGVRLRKAELIKRLIYRV